MKNNLEDLTDDELSASYDAYKTLIDAGLTKEQALERTGLTAQIVKDFQVEEGDDDFKSDFEDSWDADDEDKWKEEDDLVGGDEWEEDDLSSSGYGSNDYDDTY